MHTAIETFCVHKKGAITPKRGEVRPIHISSPGRRDLDEQMVAELVEALSRDGRFLYPIVVREEGANDHRLIAGHHRLEAWKRHFGKLRPIPVDVYPPGTPDALITILEIEENLLRKELSAAERQAETLRLAAALKKLEGEKLATELPVSGSDAKSATRGGRGKKAATAQVAAKLGLSKPAVQKRIKAASAAIDEKIDLDRDTFEELERKADKRQRAEPKAERPKRRKPALCAVTEDATPAESQAGELDSEIEEVWRAFSALSERKQLAIMLRACRLRGWALRMGRARRVSAVDEEPAVGLLPEAAPPTDAAAADFQDEQQDDAIDLGTEDLPDADHASEDVDDASDDAAEGSGDHGSDHDVSVAADDHACDDADDVSEAAAEEPGGAAKCAYCNIPFESGDQLEEFNGKLYHGFCVEDGKRLAKAKQSKQIAIAA
ncbi:MAG TPA: ParB N-terminal domain-containing protein [Methyloceanibacter sp.]|nr:ParB N-terminal domain-containing protein [Methyloceanibacter sp.]